MDADTGFADVDGGETDGERERGDSLEIDEGLPPHASDLLQVSMAGNAADQRRKEQRRDDDADELKKNLREDFGAVEKCFLTGRARDEHGDVVSELGAKDERKDDPGGERTPSSRPPCKRAEKEPAARDEKRVGNEVMRSVQHDSEH